MFTKFTRYIYITTIYINPNYIHILSTSEAAQFVFVAINNTLILSVKTANIFIGKKQNVPTSTPSARLRTSNVAAQGAHARTHTHTHTHSLYIVPKV
jgi:hypothetical protein